MSGQTEIRAQKIAQTWWDPIAGSDAGLAPNLTDWLANIDQPFTIWEKDGRYVFVPGIPFEQSSPLAGARVAGYVPALPLEKLGDAHFRREHGLRYAYVSGGMANGIASVELVESLSRVGMLSFFGAAGLDLQRIEEAIHRISLSTRSKPYGFNLIHSPSDPDLEAATVDLYLRKGVRLAEAAAYLRLTLPVVRYRVKGIGYGPDGQALTPNRILAKVSRVEVARQFFSPPPGEFLNELVRTGEITQDQAELASRVPMAQDVTAEADSAGHTDNRPLVTLLPTLLTLRNRLQEQYGFEQSLRVGAAGGLSTPASLAAAFAMGAAYVLTGSVNQACVESGSSEIVRRMLAQAEQADTAMAPAADMFEMGVKVQVLKRGTMFPMRAAKLFELYRSYPGMDALPAADRAILEKQFFRTTLEVAWDSTKAYFLKRDPREVERAERDPKHKMALVFRSYLGLSSRWANAGEPSRAIDYQVWCGPAMGAFNEWVKGSPLENPANRRAAQVAINLLYGAAVELRALNLRIQGVPCPPNAVNCAPLGPDRLSRVLPGDE